MTKREIKRAMYHNLKEQMKSYRSLDACRRYGYGVDIEKTYENTIDGYDVQLKKLCEKYSEVK